MYGIIAIEFVQFVEELAVSRRPRKFDVLSRDSHFRRILQFHADVNVRILAVANLVVISNVFMKLLKYF